MNDKTSINLHFIIDPSIGIETANSIAKIEMAKAFCKQNQVGKLHLHCMAESKKVLNGLRLSEFSDKLILKPLFFKGYKEKALHGKNIWYFCYKLFFASPIILFRAFFVAFKLRNNDRVFIRGLESLYGFYFASVITNARYGFELHNYMFGESRIVDFFTKNIMKKAAFVVTVTEYTKRNWCKNGIAEDKIIVMPSGVNIEDFESTSDNKEHLRKKLGLDGDKNIITYTGGLYENRGIEELLYCAANFENYLFLFIGGVENHIRKYKEYVRSKFGRELSNVVFKGFVEHKIVALYLKASDLLAAPYSRKVSTVLYMSPIKNIEYMASKVPAIISDLPSVKELVSDEQVTFSKPDDAHDLLEKIKLVFDDYNHAKEKALKAYEKAATLSWLNRAECITEKLCD